MALERVDDICVTRYWLSFRLFVWSNEISPLYISRPTWPRQASSIKNNVTTAATSATAVSHRVKTVTNCEQVTTKYKWKTQSHYSKPLLTWNIRKFNNTATIKLCKNTINSNNYSNNNYSHQNCSYKCWCMNVESILTIINVYHEPVTTTTTKLVKLLQSDREITL